MFAGVMFVAAALASFVPVQAPSPAPAARPAFDSFDVATIKPTEPGASDGRYLKVDASNRFVGKAYTLKLLIAAAYDLNPKTVSGGPDWVDSERYDIAAVIPSEVRPTHDEQMKMLRSLLAERFKLSFHREKKDFSMYALEKVKDAPGLKPVAPGSEVPPTVGPGVVYPPQKIVLPGRNATMGDLTSLLQRAILDRPVVDRTGLTGRYDFDLEWAPDETQFQGGVGTASASTPAVPLFVAIQQQLGLKLEAMHGPVETLMVDGVQRPTPN